MYINIFMHIILVNISFYRTTINIIVFNQTHWNFSLLIILGVYETDIFVPVGYKHIVQGRISVLVYYQHHYNNI